MGENIKMKSRKLFWKKIGYNAIVIIGFFTIVAFLSSSVKAENPDDIVFDISFDEPIVTEWNVSNITYHNVTMNNTIPSWNKGFPILPVKPLRILLPQNGTFSSLNITYDSNTSLGYGYNVSHGINESEQQENGSYFNTSIPYPTTYFNNTRINCFRGYKILTFVLHPVFYNGDSGEIFYYKNMTVTIKTNNSSFVSPLFRGLTKDEEIMKQRVDDYSMNYTYISYPELPENTSIVHSGVSYDYVIITTKSLMNSPSIPTDRREWYTFQDLADYKNSTGTRTTVVNVEAIYDIPTYNKEIDNQDTIRNFIIHAEKSWGIDYVLIGGDIDIVPARYLWYHYHYNNINEDRELPSDLYYACLDGPWNSNDNDYWGEPWDGENGDDVELVADVYVGRACVGDPIEVNNFVKKTISYDMTSILYDNQIKTPGHDPYLKKALMVGLRYGVGSSEFGKIFKDQIIDESDEEKYTTIGIPSDKYIIDCLYDKDWMDNDPLPPKLGWPTKELVNRINNNVLIINVAGHGKEKKIYRNYPFFAKIASVIPSPAFKNSDVEDLANDKYFFIWAHSCFVGKFDYEKDDCLAEYLTVKTEHGAFAAIMNAREGWGTPGSPGSSTFHPTQRYDREFFDSIFDDNIHELGKANAHSKEKMEVYLKGNDDFNNIMRQCYYELNLFGDPQLSIKIPNENSPPNQPTTPTYYTKSRKGYESKWTYTFTTDAIDPNGDKVQFRLGYRKDESDEYNTSSWQEWYFSGETAYVTIKIPYGEYLVSAQARDEFFDENEDWSGESLVKVSFDLDMQIESSIAVLQEQVQFNGQASGGTAPYNAWCYDFGDGSNSTVQNTTHSYDTIGTYNVNLTVTDNENITSNYTKIIDVVALKSDFECSPSIAVFSQQETFYFNDKSKGFYDIINWSWDFGDGNTSYERNTSHVYSSEGAYNVSLTVTDSESNNDTFYQIIYIDSVSPTVSSILCNTEVVGYGSNVTISANISDNLCGIKIVKVNISYPDSSFVNCSMNYTDNGIYEFVFSDCWQLGGYSYIVWVADQADNGYCESDGCFVVSRNFGYNQLGCSNQSIFDTITGSVFSVNEKGVADNISVYLDPGNASSDYHYRCVIYNHNNSELVGISEEKNISGVKGWQVFNFSVPKPVLLNDADYVIGCWSDNYTVKMYYDNETGTEGYYDDGSSTLQGHYFIGVYNSTPDMICFNHEDRKYSIYCCYTPDNTSPVITNVSDTPDPAGFGINVTITADIIEYQSGVNIIKVNITYLNNTQYSFDMNLTGNDTYKYVFNDTWVKGQYNYSIWTVDFANNSNISSGHSFTVSGQTTISVCTIKDEYDNNETVNLTDPPGGSSEIGYELLNDDTVLHIWNRLDSYYFDTNSGIQLTNHYNDYWSHNVLMLGYYNNDQWNLIYRTDELSGFNKDIDTDNETYVNATLWKNLNYADYDFRLAIRYHLGVDDNELTVIPYIKNLDQDDIPFVLGFGWEMKDIQINMTTSGDYIDVNRTVYYLNQTLDNVYSDLPEAEFYLMENITESNVKSLYLKWNESLDYKLQVKSRDGQYNAPVTLFIRVGTLDAGQEKYTEMFWYDADQVIYYFDSFDDSPMGEAWSSYPGYMVDGSISNFASTMSNGDVELCTGNNCSGTDIGTIFDVAVRVKSYYSGGQRDTILRPVFGGTADGADHNYQTSVVDSWSQWFDITYDPYAPQSWTWSDVESLDCDVEAEYSGGLPFTLYCSKVEIRVGYVPYNHEPTVGSPVPVDGSSGIGIQPVLNVTVSDLDGDNMNITWLSNSSGSWQVFGINSSVSDGTYHQTFSNASVNGLWWYWKVNVSDGEDYTECNVCKFYTGCQSKIKNTGSTDIKGYLLIQVQYYNESSSTWIVASDTINETTLRTINSSDQFGLDTVFNGNINTTYLIDNFGTGTYRIYTAFRDRNGEVLVCDDESLLEANYQFTASTS